MGPDPHSVSAVHRPDGCVPSCPSSPEGTVWRACQHLRARSPSGSTPTWTSMWPPWSTRRGGCAAPRRLRPRLAAMSPWSPGLNASGRWSASGWKAPAPTALAWPGLCAPTGCRSWRSTGPTAACGDAGASRIQSTPRPPRATLAGVAVTAPKTRDGQVEMIRVLRVARRGALKARVAAAEQLYEVLYSAPEELRQPLLGLKTNRAWLRQHGTTTRIARRGIESSTRPRRKIVRKYLDSRPSGYRRNPLLRSCWFHRWVAVDVAYYRDSRFRVTGPSRHMPPERVWPTWVGGLRAECRARPGRRLRRPRRRLRAGHRRRPPPPAG